ncbi:beta-N-acetylhexosaminidase [Zhouia spongiae]|uniref:beta-N-acetylhexosaminidase n=1 Tax=Zhouia spongiae TaxID=2202721 RepID=A0ABY3YLV9_9FLAO|nr:beta-N-acetylhexosaminidase [Zhouia spongiae]UNY98780.1 beta-N-acetylhexosaminidase [Zhouia spongiae]
MKKLRLLLIIILPYTIQCQDLNIIPYPNKVEKDKGFFELKPNTSIIYENDLFEQAKQYEESLERATGFSFATRKATKNKTNSIVLRLNRKLPHLGEEGYTMKVTKSLVLIEAYNSNGIFWALQTFLQLLPNDILREAKVDSKKWNIPNCKIVDKPRFAWRGLMIDYSRTFWNIRTTKKYIDALAFYKINKLHMHLTDDQGWRVEIENYPKLTDVASKFDTIYNEPKEREGYFKKSDIRELVAYAQARNIDLIPEIEMPGHSSEVFSAYPELTCKGEAMKIHPFTDGPNIHNEIFCAGNDETFVFLKNILSEIIELFPSKYVHIGGDEAPKKHWKECDKCQRRIRELNLKNEHGLQSWFISQIEDYLSSNGKILIGWDEIVEGGLSPNATVMYWRAWENEVPEFVVNQGNNLIMTPTSHCYFDYGNETITIEKVYSYNPVPSIFNKKQSEKVLGVQANFWSHINRIEPEMDRQIFPRILALAEVGWSDEQNKDWDRFTRSLNRHLKAFDVLGIYYYQKE